MLRMKLPLVIMVMALAFGLVGGRAAAGWQSIHLFDPGFEQDSGKWYFDNSKVIAGGVTHGNKCVLMHAGRAMVVSNFPMNIKGGGKLRIEFAAKVLSEGQVGGEVDVQVMLQLRSKADNSLVGSVLAGKVTLASEEAFKNVVVEFMPPAQIAEGEYYKLAIIKFSGAAVAIDKIIVGQFSDGNIAAVFGKESTPVQRMQVLREGLHNNSTENGFLGMELEKQEVLAFSKVEAAFDVLADWENPYDPEDISVDAIVTAPSGKEYRTPAFYYEDWHPVNGLTQMMPKSYRNVAAGKKWRWRFAAQETGKYSFYLQARVRGGKEFNSEKLVFNSVESDHPGFIRVSENNRYFETSVNSEAWWGCGSNVPWIRDKDPGNPLPSYEYYFGRAKGKMNATRVWLCHWTWLEWTCAIDQPGSTWSGYGGMGYYNQMVASTMDSVFALAEENGLRVMLCTEDNNEHFKDGTNSGWKANPYNQINGGPCSEPVEFYSNPLAVKYYKNRLRYIIARWGYSPSLWALNAWNDMSSPDEKVLHWLKEMHTYVHETCSDWRPVIYGTNYREEANGISDYVQPHATYPRNKPAVVQECYNISNPPEVFKPLLHDTIWQEMADGMAAVMVWAHRIVEQTNSWEVFAAPLNFAQSMKFNIGTWEAVDVRVVSAELAAPQQQFYKLLTARSYGDVSEWGQRASCNEFVIDMDRNSQWLEGIAPKLYGSRRTGWRNPPEFIVDFPEPGRVLLEVIEFGNNGQELIVSIDGQHAASWKFPNQRRYTTPEERWKTVDIPAGKHRIKVDNGGDDWIQLKRYCFTLPASNAAQLVNVTGQKSDKSGFIYMVNITDNLINQEVLKQKPVDLRNVRVKVSGVRPGKYTIQYIDSGTAHITADTSLEAKDNVLIIDVPHLRHDQVVKWVKFE